MSPETKVKPISRREKAERFLSEKFGLFEGPVFQSAATAVEHLLAAEAVELVLVAEAVCDQASAAAKTDIGAKGAAWIKRRLRDEMQRYGQPPAPPAKNPQNQETGAVK